MKSEKLHLLSKKLDDLSPDQQPLFGKMNAHQMVCHCTDQIRLALGILKPKEYGAISPKEIFTMVNLGQTVPTPKGFDQVAGEGTPPTNFEDDIKTLKLHIAKLSKLDDYYEFGVHPYFGKLNREKWIRTTIHHLGHHLKQFGL